PAHAAGARPTTGGPRWVSAPDWETSRSRNRAAAPRSPTSRDPHRAAGRRRASRPRPPACAGATKGTSCALASAVALVRGSWFLHLRALRRQLGHEQRPQLAGVVPSSRAVL